jgi:DNA repair exonuclease SbcCD ATPase subunit
MKQITLKNIKIQEFKSFENSSLVDFTGEGLILISGDNQAAPRLGANGAGKSTLWDALCFCLYGTAVRGGVRIGDLVTVGKEKCSVTTVFDIDGAEVEITRTGPPARISIDGRPKEQADVERLVGLSRTRWLNSVVFGQAVPLFVDLSVPARGELLDEILDLQLWMQAADAASKKHKVESDNLNGMRVALGRAEGALEVLESSEELIKKEDEWAAQQESRLNDLLVKFEAEERNLAELTVQSQCETKEDDLTALWGTYQKLKAEEGEVASLRDRAEQRRLTVTEDITFFKGAGDVCPICSQDITKEFASKHLEEQRELSNRLLAELKDINLAFADVRAEANEVYAAWHARNEEQKKAQVEAARTAATIKASERTLDSLERQITQVGEEVNPYTQRRVGVEETRARLNEEIREKNELISTVVDKIGALDYWKQGFRRVRLYCIQRVLQQLEVETMNAANQLGLVGWKIGYATETETKSGSIKTGVQIIVEAPHMTGSFNSWSGGEGQRVRLCVALGLAGLIQRWAGVRWNFEVFDEPTAWLAEEGIEDLLELLKTRADVSGRPIFLCDHRALTFAGFSRVMTVVKDAEGSRVQ